MKDKFDLKKFLLNKNVMKVITALAFLGIVLIAFTDFFVPKEETIEESVNYDYSLILKGQLEDVVKAITGETSPEVMVTLSSDEKYVYATDSKESIDNEKKESEENYIVVENSAGEELGMIVTKIQPEIKGVVVVSQAGYDSVLKEDIINAVMTVLDIPGNKVCVVGKNN